MESLLCEQWFTNKTNENMLFVVLQLCHPEAQLESFCINICHDGDAIHVHVIVHKEGYVRDCFGDARLNFVKIKKLTN